MPLSRKVLAITWAIVVIAIPLGAALYFYTAQIRADLYQAKVKVGKLEGAQKTEGDAYRMEVAKLSAELEKTKQELADQQAIRRVTGLALALKEQPYSPTGNPLYEAKQAISAGRLIQDTSGSWHITLWKKFRGEITLNFSTFSLGRKTSDIDLSLSDVDAFFELLETLIRWDGQAKASGIDTITKPLGVFRGVQFNFVRQFGKSELMGEGFYVTIDEAKKYADLREKFMGEIARELEKKIADAARTDALN